MTIAKISALVIFAFFVFIACAEAPKNVAVNTKPAATPAATAAPAATPGGVAQITSVGPDKLFADNCAACHKESGKGGKITIEGRTIKPDDLTSAKMAAKTDEQLYNYISNGIPDEGMPAFKGKLVEPEIRNLVIHLRYLQKKS